MLAMDILGDGEVNLRRRLFWHKLPEIEKVSLPHTRKHIFRGKRNPRSIKVTLNDTCYANWLNEHFGELSHAKRIPAWVMSHPLRHVFYKAILILMGHQVVKRDLELIVLVLRLLGALRGCHRLVVMFLRSALLKLSPKSDRGSRGKSTELLSGNNLPAEIVT